MSRSTPPTPSTPSSSALAPSLGTTLPPFSTTSTARLQALYSDFSRQKQSNPTSYHANVEWWRKAFEALVSSGKQDFSSPVQFEDDDDTYDLMTKSGSCDRLVLHAGRGLMERLKIPRVGKPLALGDVVSELQHTHVFFSLSHFVSSKASIYDPGWLPVRIAKTLVGKPLWWALEQMGVVGEDGMLGSLTSSTSGGGRRSQESDSSWWGDYVSLALLERAAGEVMERHERRMRGSRADALFTVEEFRRAFGGVAGGGEDEFLRELDAKVLVKYLERDKGIVVVDKEVIKFVDKATQLEDRTVTAIDRGILELKTAISKLHAQVEALHSKIDECTKKATTALQQKRKPVALGYIRSRKLLEDVLQKRLGSLSTLESTFISVEAAAGDVEIMKNYESSTATLRALLAHPSLQRSKIDETMEALAEANADAKEVDEAIWVGSSVAAGVAEAVDEDELEEEWKAMVREAEDEKEIKKRKEEVKEKLAQLDATPNDGPLEASSAKERAEAVAAT